MALQFTIDPQTGVWKPPVTVFNGGAVQHSKRSVKNRSVTVFNGGKRSKRKTRKSKKSRKGKAKTYRRRH